MNRESQAVRLDVFVHKVPRESHYSKEAEVNACVHIYPLMPQNHVLSDLVP